VRGPDEKLVLKEETGLVFVLLPGETFTMGAQRSDPAGPNYDPQAGPDEGPPHAVTLSPFFLSKCEMTQGQWLRFVGRNPSNYQPHGGLAPSLLHPVEQVSWNTCMEICERLGLSLPSEALWEYGARGGSTAPWWTGSERDSLVGSANLADQAAKRAGVEWQDIKDWPELDDGYAVHAPVNRFQANAFGLHNVHGNVWEWCLDGYDGDFYKQPASRDPVSPPGGSSYRVARGGGFYDAAAFARSAYRLYATPERADAIGLRPVRRIEP
jgi:formylglycine-generating enzyme required for sulfatase activity